MLMDDTVLLSTSKEDLIEKFKMGQCYCSEYGISVNQPKTKFMVINDDLPDRENKISGGIIAKYCKSYKYLGIFITDEGCYRTMLEIHREDRMKNVIKCFMSLINSDFKDIVIRQSKTAAMDMADPSRKAFDLAQAAKTKSTTIIEDIIKGNVVFADQPVCARNKRKDLKQLVNEKKIIPNLKSKH